MTTAPIKGVTPFPKERFAPELHEALGLLEAVDLEDLAAARAGAVADPGAPDPRVVIREVVVESADGHLIPLRLYDGRDGRDGGAVLHLHGGAFIAGDLDFEHRRSVAIAGGAACLVASVDYRLAPEHPYPAGLDDAAAALEWLVARARELELNPLRLGVMGSSAGGCLAAALALRCRDRGGPYLAFQLLVYPVTDVRLASGSITRFANVPGFSGANARQMWQHYLAGQPPDALASPALAHRLAGLPPTYLSVAEFDPLRDEGVDYALRLIAEDVPVELRVFPGTWHGFDLAAPDSDAARAFLAAEVAAARRLLGG